MNIWPDDKWIAWTAFLLGTSLIIWPIVAFFFRKKTASSHLEFPQKNRFISLPEAARQVYGGIRTVDSSHGYIRHAACFSDRSGGDLDYLATAISQVEDAIYGKSPPSTRLELLDIQAIRTKGSFTNGGNDFIFYGQKTPEHTDLHIKNNRISKIIETMLSHMDHS